MEEVAGLRETAVHESAMQPVQAIPPSPASRQIAGPPGEWSGWEAWQLGEEPAPRVVRLGRTMVQVIGAGTSDANGIYKGNEEEGFQHTSGEAKILWNAYARRFHLDIRDSNCYCSSSALPKQNLANFLDRSLRQR